VASFPRQLVLLMPLKGWTPAPPLAKLINITVKLMRHSKYILFHSVEVAVPRQFFARIMVRIARLCPACASA
jgi:hypothetical protein